MNGPIGNGMIPISEDRKEEVTNSLHLENRFPFLHTWWVMQEPCSEQPLIKIKLNLPLDRT